MKAYLDIAGEIKEIVSFRVLLIDLISQELDGVLIGYILYHQSSPRIIFYVVNVDDEVSWIVVPVFISIIEVHDVFVGSGWVVSGILIGGRSDGLVLLMVSSVRIIVPDLFVRLFILFPALGFYLFYLLPVEADTVHLYFIQDLVAGLSEDVGRLTLSPQYFAVTIYFGLGLFGFYMIFFLGDDEIGGLGVDSGGSGWFASLYEGA